ncbi:hypothetical protein [[Mycobacterium] crassicus]|uniref:DUF1214 domain-containing protein n=1 Tax=[Mycobacterium] crassicus TaxID=2872309 RepID=A0ABU5XKR0_9MYCO|nr:hypothetical protein [Mycolicibacter sp. MYC098]MEB3022870.1 hypothetical protein [Mycolicibacter sp. MYC098]
MTYVQAAGAGALAIAMMSAPAAVLPVTPTNVTSPAWVLTASGASAYQAALDAIIAAQQQIIETNSAYPWATAFDKTLLPGYVQGSALMQLYFNMGQLNLSNGFDQGADKFVYLWNAPAAEPLNFLNDPNPDTQYYFNSLGDETKVITIYPKSGTEDLSFTAMSGTGTPSGFTSLHAYDLRQFTPNSDGSYTVYVSPTEHAGNWVNSAGAETLAIRNSIGDWGMPHATLNFAVENQPGFVLPVLSADQISSMLSNVATDLPGANASSLLFGVQQATNTLPPNFITPIRGTTEASPGGPLLPGQFGSGVHFNLEPDQALVLKVPVLDAPYGSISIDDAWTTGAPAALAQSSLNNTQAFHGSDGFVYYVVSSKDPGVANWLDSGDLRDGLAVLRWQGVTGTVPTAMPTAQVVDIADVRDYLPADMPLVTAAERAADLQERMLEYFYVQHQDYDSGWITAHLEYDQIKAAVGAEQFNEIFGAQQDVPSILERLISPELGPDTSSVLQAVLADPAGGMAALINNLPLLVKDVTLPMILAVLRTDIFLGQTIQEVSHAFQTGDLSDVFTDRFSALQTLIEQTLTDPATSIASGFLNARDDLGVSLLHSDTYTLGAGDFASAWSELSAYSQTASDMLSAGFGYLTDLG